METYGGACPSRRILERLLAEQLAGQERDSVEIHVEDCTKCQVQLETIIGAIQSPVRLNMAHPADADLKPADTFLARLRQLPPPSSASGIGSSSAVASPGRDDEWHEGDRLGQYEILGRLGTGGMGAVFKARHVELGKVVALKMLRAERADEVSLARFKNEIRAVGRLDHPNIVVAHDAGQAGGTHFLVMDYVDGMDLARLVERSGPLTTADACEVIRQAAVGLQHAYEHGLVHRDVKPSNLMLARDGRVRVLDLGLARSLGDSAAETLTTHGMILGTADYLAPEQWQHPHEADTRSDIYSLGCTLYHLLTGTAPFADSSYLTVRGKMHAHVRVPAPIEEDCPGIPAALGAVLRRMLAKDPADRFETPADVATALESFADGCDLRRLLERADEGGGPIKELPTRSREAPRRSRRILWLFALGLVMFSSLAVGTVIIGSRGRQPPAPVAPTPVAPAPVAPASVAPAPLAIQEFHVNQFRGKQAKPLGDLRDNAEEIRVNDSVRLFARLNAPAHCYLIAFNPDGSEQLCHPAWDGDRPDAARAVRPGPVTEVRFFPDDKGMFGLDASGLQVFVLVGSRRPLPPYAEWRSGAGTIPWRAVSHGGGWRWQFDGEDFIRLPADRGQRTEREAEPQALRSLCAFFRGRPEFEVVRVIAFPVAIAEPIGQLDAKSEDLCREGKFVDAQEPTRQKIALLVREKGENHFQTNDTRRSLRTLEQLAALPAEAQREFAMSYSVHDDMARLVKKGKYLEALPLAKRVMEMRGHVLGPDHETVAVAMVECAQLSHYSSRYAEAEKLFRRALVIVRQLGGDAHPAVAKVSGDLAMSLDAQDKYAEAEPFYQAAVKIMRDAYGPDHEDTAIPINNLASHLDRQARFSDAEPLYRKSLDILRRAYGDDHRRVATARNNLAYNLGEQGKYAEAEALYRTVLESRRNTTGEYHPDMALSYSNLAVNLDEQGRHAEADWLYHKALDINRRVFGEDNPKTAISLNNLAMNLQHQRKYEEAEPYFREALAIHRRAAPGGVSRLAAGVHHNLAANLRGQGKLDAAREQLERSLEIHRKLLGNEHPDVAQCYLGIARLFNEEKRNVEAEPLVRRAIDIFQKKLGDEHPRTLSAQVSLANNLHNQGRYKEADLRLKRSLEIYRRALGESHVDTTSAYLNLVKNLWAQGDYREIEVLGPLAAASFEAVRPRLSSVGLARADRTLELSPLLSNLAAAAAHNGHAAAAWQYLEARLARGLFDDLSAHPLTGAERESQEVLFAQIDRLNRQIAARPGHQAGTVSAEAEADKLRSARDEAQARLAAFRVELAAKYGVTAGKIYDLKRIQQRLPPDTALVGWVDIVGNAKFRDPQGAHWACAVRHQGDPSWVRLTGTGAGGAWCALDESLPSKVRSALADRSDVTRGSWKDSMHRLYGQRLAPLEPYLGEKDGLRAVRQLIVLPADVMAGIPVEALTDRFTISYAPSGTTFAWLQERGEFAGGGQAGMHSSSLLAVGDPAFRNVEPGDTKSEPSARSETSFTRLPATGKEIRALSRVFAHANVLLGSEASEKNLERMAAAGELRNYRFIHFATHGLVDNRRALNSALILAQERPPDSRPALPGKGADDGRLTAEEILRHWQLDADLVTLSACETALGKESGGEGYLGFSQALFLAGARATVLSLWRVDDRAAALLMTRFYENMLGTPDGSATHATKAAALAEAKHWLRGLSALDVERLTSDLPKGLPFGTRGVRKEAPKGAVSGSAPRPFEHPYYWAAFILIGDPR
jgi:serine/threonine protein kinase/tetratricopeptide (TPR) repeat protein